MNKYLRQNLNLEGVNVFYQSQPTKLCSFEGDAGGGGGGKGDDPKPTETINDDPKPDENDDPKPDDNDPPKPDENDPPKDDDPKKTKTMGDHLDGKSSLMEGLDFSATEKPKGLDDKYWDAENNTLNHKAIYDFAIEESKRANGLRATVSKKGNEDKDVGKAPESIDGYKLELSDSQKELLKEDNDFIKALKEEALTTGATADEWEKKIAPILFNAYEKHMKGTELTEEQVKAKEDEYFATESAKLGANGAALIRKAEAFSESLFSRGIIPEDEQESFIQRFRTDAVGIRFLNRIENMVTGENSMPTDVEQDDNDGLPPDSEILAFMQSDDYQNEKPEAIKKWRDWMTKRAKSNRPAQMQA